PIPDALAVPHRPLDPIDPVIAIGTVVVATILVIAARMVRPLLPDLDALATRLQRFVWAADPVPAGAATFRALERAVTVASAGFAAFEQRAGVWLAAVLIVALLAWSTRSVIALGVVALATLAANGSPQLPYLAVAPLRASVAA